MGIAYTAYGLNKKAYTNLNKNLEKFTTDNNIDMKDGEISLHHVTSTLGALDNTMNSGKAKNKSFQENMSSSNLKMGDEIVLKVVSIGINPDTGVIAYGVEAQEENQLVSKNEHPHVTAYIPEGQKAFSSNDIVDWVALEEPILIKTIFSEFAKNENGKMIDAHIAQSTSKPIKP